MQRDRVSLEDIRSASQRALDYVLGMTHGEFLSDNKTKAAVVRELEIIGEAASRISTTFKQANPTAPWSRLIRLRNFYAHVYDAIDYTLVWNSLHRLLPEVDTSISELLAGMDAEAEAE